MRIEPIHFRDFSSGAAGATSPRKSHSHGGRRKEETPPPPPVITYSEEQLKAAEAEAYKKGFIEGTKEGHQQAQTEQADIDRALSQTVENFTVTIAPLLDDYRNMLLQLRQDIPKVALAIARKVAGNALSANAQAAVEEIALQCAHTMVGEPKIAITVHASLSASLEQKIKAMPSLQQCATAFIVAGSDTIALADCRIEWKHGAMERHTGQLWEAVERVVESMCASAPRETDKQIQPLAAQLLPTTPTETEKE